MLHVEGMVQKPMHIFFISRYLQDGGNGAVREGMVQKLVHTFPRYLDVFRTGNDGAPCGGDGAKAGHKIYKC